MAKIAIPETSEELEELLGDVKRVEQYITAGQFPDVIKAYARATDDRGKLAEIVKESIDAAFAGQDALKTTVEETVKAAMEKTLGEYGVNRPSMADSVGRDAAEHGAAYNRHAIGAHLDKEFTSTADFLISIWHQNQAGQDRWRKIRNDYSSIDPAAGGFLVPEILRSELLRLALESSVVRPRARVIPMDSARVPFPAIDTTSHASSVFGGITATWTEEGGTLNETEARFGRVVLQAAKLATHCDVPNELLTDSIVSFAALIEQLLPEAIAWYEDTAFLTGSGVGQPLGVLNSAALVSVTKETNQVADTIVWENLVKMYSRMLPGSLGRAVWVANNDCFPELATMALSVGTGGSAIWMNNGVNGPPATILGRPVILTEKVPTIGGAGSGKDISFIDFGYYLIGDRQQMRAESSIHAKFTTDLTTYRVIERVDGRGWLLSALTPANSSNTLSPFVTLGERG
ncbi:MAG: phage major capsid protein [Dehalococcoidia bacterium]|nr:phage major capsid protein [Dehalococcoidia bacterium]